MKNASMSAIVGAIAGALVMAATSAQAQRTDNRWGANYFPNVPVVTQDGERLMFYDDLVKGKIVVFSFIFTSCTDICPLTTARMSQVEDKLGDLVGREIFFYSMTVDPENDTPEKLKSFSKAFGAGPGWRFLTGKAEDVRAINYALGDRSRTLSEHRNEIVLGNDATGEWGRNSVFGDLDRVVMDIRGMDPKWRGQIRTQPHVPASNTGYTLSDQPGQSLFKKLCAPCHSIGVGDRVGPDLRGVHKRRSNAWLTNFIMRPDEMRAQKDPIALALVSKFEGVRMPRLGLTKIDAADLIAYLTAQNASLDAAQVDIPGKQEPQSTQPHHHH